MENGQGDYIKRKMKELETMRQQAMILQELNRIKDKHLEVCMFGCGNIGIGGGYDILKFLGIDVQYYSDNDAKFWGEIIKDNIRCIPPEDLYKKDVVCFVMTGFRFQNEIVNQLKENCIKIVITFFELCSLDTVVDQFIKKCSEKKQNTCQKRISMEC